MKPNRDHEQACAERLVALLVERHQLPLHVWEVTVAANRKVAFRFLVTTESLAWKHTQRVGRRPGLEIDWLKLEADVDAWQFDGDLQSLIMHGWQIFKKWVSMNEELPSKLLAVVEKQIARKEAQA